MRYIRARSHQPAIFAALKLSFRARGFLGGCRWFSRWMGYRCSTTGWRPAVTTESGAPALFYKLPVFWEIAERRPEFLVAINCSSLTGKFDDVTPLWPRHCYVRIKSFARFDRWLGPWRPYHPSRAANIAGGPRSCVSIYAARPCNESHRAHGRERYAA